MVVLESIYGMGLNMNKKYMALILGTAIYMFGNEFTKKPNRKGKAQQEALYESCLEGIDRLIDRGCRVQGSLAPLIGNGYAILRSCALEEKSALSQVECQKLKLLLNKIECVEKQLQELEETLSDSAFNLLKSN